MKKGLAALLGVVTFFTLTAVSAEAAERDTLRVGLRYGTSALFSANLENAVGEGYEFGYFENIVEFDPTGINNVITSNDAKELSRYSLNGQRLSAPSKGLNIVKYSDGSVKKVVVQ